jgi:hypothetical protein
VIDAAASEVCALTDVRRRFHLQIGLEHRAMSNTVRHLLQAVMTMKPFARSTKAIMGVALGMLALGAGFEACSSSSGGPPAGFGPDGSTGGEGGVQTQCTNPTLNIVFSPMYSAYIPGSTMHSFQIPAVLDDGSMATWSVSDSTKATLAPQSIDVGGGDMIPGTMITVTGTGMVQVIATNSSGCGVSTLNITSATEDDWQTGSQRYNNGTALHLGGGGDGGGFMRPDGGFPEGGFMRPEGGMGGFNFGDGGCSPLDRGYDAGGGLACTNCHGATGMTLFTDVQHTPEQTGGFSDEDLINIIVNGEIPDGGYFDPTVILPSCDGSADCTAQAYQTWHSIHRWCDISTDEYTGIVTYLRSLTPAPQTGTSNFGGGGHHRDGGRPPMPDSGGGTPSNDAASE